MTCADNREEKEKAPEATAGESETQGGYEGEPYPPFLEYLQSEQGHQLASRLLALVEDIKKATIESVTERHKRDSEFHHRIYKLWLCLQAAVFSVTVVVAAVLAWHGKFDATVAALMGTLFGYFLGRPLN